MKTFALGVVAALALGLGAASAQTTVIERDSATGAITITPEQRTIIRREIITERAAPAPDVEVQVGGAVPEGVELMALPRDVVVEVPAYRSYKYFQAGDEVVIVDTRRNRIVEVID